LEFRDVVKLLRAFSGICDEATRLLTKVYREPFGLPDVL